MRELFGWVYRILRSKLLGVLVILAMAALALLGTLIMQAPEAAIVDPAARAEWLDSVRPRYGGWTPVLEFLGLFNIWTSPLFLGVTVLLALSIIACTVNRLPLLIERATRPRTHVSDKFFTHAQYRAEIALPLTPHEALDHTQSVLKSRHYRILPDEKAPDEGLYADRFRFGPFGTAIAHASFIIILAAFAISALIGFDRTLEVGIGETVDVGHAGLQLTALSFHDSYDEQGRPLDYVSHLVVSRGGQTLGEADEVRVNKPLKVEGVAFHQASFGIAAQVRIASGGAEIFNGSVPLKWRSNDDQYAIGKIELANGGEVLVVTPASGASGGAIPAGSAIFELYDAAGAKQGVLPVDQGGTVTEAGVSYTFERELRYTGILVRSDPGAVWMWIGSALLVIGMTMTFTLRHRRVWARVEQDGNDSVVRLASAEKLDTTFERQFRAIVDQIDATAPISEHEEVPADA